MPSRTLRRALTQLSLRDLAELVGESRTVVRRRLFESPAIPMLPDGGGVMQFPSRAALERGWPEVPPWIFCSTQGTPLEANLGRLWERVRRRAKAAGIRPLKLHSTRHTFATHALRAGKSIRWVAAQLGHADPALTLRVYAHALREEESDLGFADFGTALDTSGRPQTAPASEGERTGVPQLRVIPGAPGLTRTADQRFRKLGERDAGRRREKENQAHSWRLRPRTSLRFSPRGRS